MLIAEDIRHGGDNNEGDDEDDRSGGDDVEELLEPAPPEKRRKVEDATRDAVAEELRQILDRGGAVAKAKYVRRFYQLMSRERRLKHRLTLLTVVRLTRAPLQQELLNEGLLQVLFRWMSEAKATAERQVSTKLLRPVLEFLTELSPVSLYHTGAGLLQQTHKDLLEALIASPHLDTELRAMTERLLERWNAVGVYPTTTTVDQKISTAAVSSSSLLENRITLENECCDQMLLPEAHVSLHHHVEAIPPPPPPPSSTTTPSSSMIITAKNLESVPPAHPPRSSLVTPSLDVSRVPCSTAAASAIVGERGVRRVEGLNSPFPRAFKQKPLLLVPQSDVPSSVPKRICKTQKRVRWASADSLVSIQLFRESDPPIQLFQSGSGIASSAAAASLAAKHECCTLSTEPDLCSALAPDLKAEVEWLMPIALEIKASWRVQRGEESEEKRNQTNRERHVLAFDPENVIGDIDPDEPYHEDTIQDPKHRSKIITLNNPKDPLPTSKPVQVRSSVTPTGQAMTMWPGVVVVPSGPLLFPSAPLQQSASSVPPTVPFMQTPAAGFPLQIPQPVYFVSGIPRSLH